MLDAEHSSAISAKLASALSSLRQVIKIQDALIHLCVVIECCQDFARDDKKGKQGGGGLVDGLVKKRQQLLLNRDIVSAFFHSFCYSFMQSHLIRNRSTCPLPRICGVSVTDVLDLRALH